MPRHLSSSRFATCPPIHPSGGEHSPVSRNQSAVARQNTSSSRSRLFGSAFSHSLASSTAASASVGSPAFTLLSVSVMSLSLSLKCAYTLSHSGFRFYLFRYLHVLG